MALLADLLHTAHWAVCVCVCVRACMHTPIQLNMLYGCGPLQTIWPLQVAFAASVIHRPIFTTL